MAKPTSPTARSIATQGLIRAGHPTPSPELLKRAETQWIPELVNEILTLARTTGDGVLRTLHTTAVALTVANLREYAVPGDYDSDMVLTLLDGTSRGTVQAATLQDVTLAASESISQTDAQGSYILMTAGTSAGQYRQITAYDATTKVATVADAWDVGKTPLAADTYMIVERQCDMDEEFSKEFDENTLNTVSGPPQCWMQFGNSLYLDPPPEKVYGLRLRYYADPTQVDLTDPIWTAIYERWQAALTAGVKLYAEEELDDDRSKRTRENFATLIGGVIARERPYEDEFEGLTL